MPTLHDVIPDRDPNSQGRREGLKRVRHFVRGETSIHADRLLNYIEAEFKRRWDSLDGFSEDDANDFNSWMDSIVNGFCPVTPDAE